MDDLGQGRQFTAIDSSDLCAEISKVLIEAIPMPIFCKSEDGRYVDGNRLFFEFIGRDRQEIIGHTVFELFDPEKAAVYDAADRELWRSGTTQEYEGMVDNGDGMVSVVRFHKKVVTVDSIGQRIMVGAILDVTDLRRTEAQLQKAVRTDELTGLHNRKAFMEYLDALCLRAHRQEIPFALMVLDMDGFKAVNDVHGHAAGDEVLKRVAERLRSSVRETDFIARMGGDEFTIILEGAKDYGACCHVAEKVIKSVRQPLTLEDGNTVYVGVSIGASLWHKDGHGCDGMLDVADMAMYRAKGLGKGCICYGAECRTF